MKKIFLLTLIFVSASFFRLYPVNTELSRAILSTLDSSLNRFVDDYGSVQGLTLTSSFYDGRASTGAFPSFKLDFSLGSVFQTTPFAFLSDVSVFGWTFDNMKTELGATYDNNLAFFDNYFFPLPAFGSRIEVGLPMNFSAGLCFNVLPLTPIFNYASQTVPALAMFGELMYWSVGSNLRYTILRDANFTPDVSVNFGVIYSDFTFALTDISVGSFDLDTDNKSVPAAFGFNTRFCSTVFYLEAAISKKFMFFRPFLNMKLVQTLVYNESEFYVQLDMTGATGSAKDVYGNGRMSSSNYADGTGVIGAYTDFVITTGFDFVMGIFTLGLQGGFSTVTRKGSATLAFGFNPDRAAFIKENNR